MRARTCILFLFTLSTAMSYGIAAIAADLPKEGTYKGTYFGYGTYKTNSFGNDRMVTVFGAVANCVETRLAMSPKHRGYRVKLRGQCIER
jgi:hypothetical protein